jgi:hypothetical protein
MSHWYGGRAPWTVVLATLMMPAAWAQEFRARPVAQAAASPTPITASEGAVIQGQPSQPGYVQLGAPLYPSPRPNIPIWTGGTFITNQALAPHEMLYPHTYRSLHGPYYHRVTGTYMWTPFGMRTHEKWELQGTMVTVKYRSHQPFLKKLAHPTIWTSGGAWD